jgi:hypothetical protein
MSLRHPKNRLSTAVADWRRRCDELVTSLRAAATHDDAWQWRIHLRILRFLLRRYGQQAIEPVESIPDEETIAIDPEVVGPIDLAEGRPPRSREQIRAVLIRIAVANGGGTLSRPLVRAA